MTFTRYANLELLDLPDCDGLLENGQCDCLEVPACLGYECSFIHKTDNMEKVYARLRVLPEERQEHISQKYYQGVRPWAESAAKPRRKPRCTG